MMIETKSKLKKSEWNEIKKSAAYLSPLQSPIYADFVETVYGQKPVYLLGTDSGGRLQFYALLIENKKRFFSHGAIKQGPVILDNSMGKKVLDDAIEQILVDCRLTSLSIELPLVYPFHGPEKVKEYYETFLIDLTKTEDDLWNDMKKNYRKDIRYAMKNIQLVQITSENDPHLQEFCDLALETKERVAVKGIELDMHKYEFYAKFIKFFVKKNYGVFNIALRGDKVLAGSGIISEGNVSLFWFSASTRDEPYIRGTQNLLMWEDIIWSKTQGYQWYDLGGIGPGSTSPENGIYTFKKRFGGKFVRAPISNLYSNSINAKTYRILRNIKNRIKL